MEYDRRRDKNTLLASFIEIECHSHNASGWTGHDDKTGMGGFDKKI